MMNELSSSVTAMSDIVSQMMSFTFPVMGILILIAAIFKIYTYARDGRELGGVIPMFFAGIFLFSAPNVFESILGEQKTQSKSNIIAEYKQEVNKPNIQKDNLYKKEVTQKEKYVKKEVQINWKMLFTIFGSIIGFIFSIVTIVSLITTISYFILKRKTLKFINIENNLLNVADNISLISEQISYNNKFISHKILFQNKVEELNEKLKNKYSSIEKYLSEQESKLVN
jgi:hypothetical protein